MKQAIALITLICFLPTMVLGIGPGLTTKNFEVLTSKRDNQNISILPTGSGSVILGNLNGVLKANSGVTSAGLVDLTSEITGVLPVANGGTGSATKNYVDLSLPQTVGGEKTFEDALVMTELANTPVTPSAGLKKIYSKDDGKVYTLNSSGEEREVGSGSGSGGINYYDNSDFENTIDASYYDDGASNVPVDGVDGGGTADVAMTAELINPLRGTRSAKYQKGPSNAQGDGINLPIPDIDVADQAKMLSITFDYDASYAGYEDGELRFFIKDNTNNKIIRAVRGEELPAGKGSHHIRFQTSPDSLSYSLLLHTATTDTDFIEILIENLKVGPREASYGAPITNWKEFSPVFDNDAGISFTFTNSKFRRVGQNLEISIRAQATGNGTSGSLVLLNLPSGLNAVSNLIGGTGTQISAGGFYDTNATNPNRALSYWVNSASKLGFILVGVNESQSALNGTDVDTSDQLNIELSVPIQGWSSNSKMSEEVGGRELVTRISESLSQTIADNSEDKIAFSSPTIIEDTSSSWDSINKRINILEGGFYDMEGVVSFGSGSDDDANAGTQIYVNGSRVTSGIVGLTAGNTNNLKNTLTAYRLEKGDYVELYAYFADVVGTGSVTVSSGGLTVAKRSSPQTSYDSETVSLRYTTDSGQSIGTSATDIVFEDLVFDTHNAYNSSNGIFTSPVTGFYQVNSSATAAADGDSLLYYILKNGGNYVRVTNRDGQSNTGVVIGDLVYLPKGESIRIRLQAGVSTNLVTDSTRNYLSIHRIK